jgi:tetratricopeptide (TPR) repeat protein
VSQAIEDRAEALLAGGNPEEAMALSAPLANRADAPHSALALHSTVLKTLQRPHDALPYDVQATQRFAQSPVAWHNLAATLGDLGRGAESRVAAEKAFSLGLDAPQTWSLYARALLATGDLEGALRAYAATLARAPAMADVAIEMANVLWMRDADLQGAAAVIDRSAQAGGPIAQLAIAKSKLFEAAGDPAAGADFLARAVAQYPRDLSIVLAAAQSGVETGRLDEAWRLAQNAMVVAPQSPDAYNQAAIVLLARGEPKQALDTARRGLAINPYHQSLLGWSATAARLIGDPLYEQLYDYERVVGVFDIEPPAGWSSLEAFLADLATVLRRMHPYTQHPFHQSIRHGSQTLQALSASSDPVLGAFFQAIDKPIRDYMAGLGEGSDPLRARNTGKYLMDSAWSVLLRPGGFHKDHFHPRGWLSSAFYVETPDQALEADDKQGWIRFGQPPLALEPPLGAAHYVKPKAGRLVLFPSYMFHGTVPFTTDERRMTIAFDAVPA